MLPRSGDVISVGKAASVQFAAPILVRVIRVLPRETYVGWIWLDVYELNQAGDAVERREIFVQIAGLRAVGRAPDPRSTVGKSPTVQRSVTRNGRQPDRTVVRAGEVTSRQFASSPQRNTR